jgi:hypothetical protein
MGNSQRLDSLSLSPWSVCKCKSVEVCLCFLKVSYLLLIFILQGLFLIHEYLADNDTVTYEGYTHHNQAKTVSFWILHINDSCSKSPDHISPSIHDSCQL